MRELSNEGIVVEDGEVVILKNGGINESVVLSNSKE